VLSAVNAVIGDMVSVKIVLQGSDDDFLHKGQLLPKNFVAACAEATVPVVLRMQEVILSHF
jgi:S-formylglutathione hydrolase